MRWWAWLALVGCGRFGFDPAPAPHDTAIDAIDGPPAAWTSGTRLRAVVFDGGSGAIAFDRWHDLELDLDCEFVRASDGVQRCLPFASLATSLFADAACMRPAVGFDKGTQTAACGRMPKFARDGNDSTNTVHALGSMALGTVYQQGTTCFATPQAPGFEGYELLAVVSPTMFVAATERQTRHGRLSYVETVAQDGATSLSPRALDSQTGTTCNFRELESGRWSCLPTSSFEADIVYKDAACTEVELMIAQPSDGRPVAGTGFARHLTTCSDEARTFTIGAKVGNGAYVRSGSSCTLHILGGADVYTATEIPLAALVSATRHLPPSGIRLGATALVTDDGFTVPDTVWDHARGGPCRPSVLAGPDVLVCVPEQTDAISVFTDSACSAAPTLVYPSCRATPGTLISATTKSTCDGITVQALAFDALVLAGPRFEAHLDGSCTAIGSTVDLRPLSGSFIESATLAPVHRVTE